MNKIILPGDAEFYETLNSAADWLLRRPVSAYTNWIEDEAGLIRPCTRKELLARLEDDGMFEEE